MYCSYATHCVAVRCTKPTASRSNRHACKSCKNACTQAANVSGAFFLFIWKRVIGELLFLFFFVALIFLFTFHSLFSLLFSYPAGTGWNLNWLIKVTLNYVKNDEEKNVRMYANCECVTVLPTFYSFAARLHNIAMPEEQTIKMSDFVCHSLRNFWWFGF